MKKVYNIDIVGADHGMVIGRSQNIIANNALEAYNKLEPLFDKVWSAHAKFQFKETIKVWILDLLGCEKIVFKLPKIEITKKNEK